jgi:hypothetical protein
MTDVCFICGEIIKENNMTELNSLKETLFQKKKKLNESKWHNLTP